MRHSRQGIAYAMHYLQNEIQMRYFQHQKGMTLLEVVIAMLIIGLGMTMSIAMIQTSVKNSISAHNRDTARMLLESISDRMRINSYAASAYRFGDPDNNIDNNGESVDLIGESETWAKPTQSSLSSNNPAPDCLSCTDKQRSTRTAAFNQGYSDVTNWVQNVENTLPNARAAILELPANQYRALLQWQNGPAGQTTPVQEVSLTFTL